MAIQSQHFIYRTLDNSSRILFWTTGEVLFMLTPFFIGISCGSLLISCLGILLKPFYTKLKKKFPNGLLIHKLYWILPTSAFGKVTSLKSLPPSHYREFIL
jgi:type IV conjugative transfer system protein TraL